LEGKVIGSGVLENRKEIAKIDEINVDSINIAKEKLMIAKQE